MSSMVKGPPRPQEERALCCEAIYSIDLPHCAPGCQYISFEKCFCRQGLICTEKSCTNTYQDPAFLAFLALLPSCRINNLRVFSGGAAFKSPSPHHFKARSCNQLRALLISCAGFVPGSTARMSLVAFSGRAPGVSFNTRSFGSSASKRHRCRALTSVRHQVDSMHGTG